MYGETKNPYKSFVRKFEEKRLLGRHHRCRRKNMLKWVLNVQRMMTWNGLIWLGTESNCSCDHARERFLPID